MVSFFFIRPFIRQLFRNAYRYTSTYEEKVIRDFNFVRKRDRCTGEKKRRGEFTMIKSSVSRYHLPQKLGTARFNGFLTVYNATRNLFVMYLVLWIILTAFCCSKRTGLKEIVFLADITRRTIKLPSSSHHVTRDSPSPFEITSYEQRLIRGKKRKKGNDVALSKTLGQFRPHFVVISTTNETCVPIR